MTDAELVAELRDMTRAYRDLEAKHPASGFVAAIGFAETVATMLEVAETKKGEN